MRTHLLLPTAAFAIVGAVQVVSFALPREAAAQSAPVIPSIPESEAVTLQAEITAIGPRTRHVTLVDASGKQVTVVAGPNVRLNLRRVGDKVNAKYYHSVAFVVNPPATGNGVPVSDDAMKQMIAQNTTVPGGFSVSLTKVSGTIMAIDMAAHSLELVNPSFGIYTIDVTDPSRIAMLGSLKVGDTVTAVISQAMAVSIESASWF